MMKVNRNYIVEIRDFSNMEVMMTRERKVEDGHVV